MIDFLEEVYKRKDAMIEDIQTLCQIPSVLDETTANEGQPFGETPHEALIRELKEETGLDIKIIKPVYTFTAIRPDYQTVGIGFLTIPTNDHVQLSHEHTDYQFVSSTELLQYIDKKIYDDIIMTLKEYESMHIED